MKLKGRRQSKNVVNLAGRPTIAKAAAKFGRPPTVSHGPEMRSKKADADLENAYKEIKRKRVYAQRAKK